MRREPDRRKREHDPDRDVDRPGQHQASRQGREQARNWSPGGVESQTGDLADPRAALIGYERYPGSDSHSREEQEDGGDPGECPAAVATSFGWCFDVDLPPAGVSDARGELTLR